MKRLQERLGVRVRGWSEGFSEKPGSGYWVYALALSGDGEGWEDKNRDHSR